MNKYVKITLFVIAATTISAIVSISVKGHISNNVFDYGINGWLSIIGWELFNDA